MTSIAVGIIFGINHLSSILYEVHKNSTKNIIITEYKYIYSIKFCDTP